MTQPANAKMSESAESATTFTNSADTAQFLIKRGTYLKALAERHDGVAVAAYVFNPDGKLLLVQRAATDTMPLLWEVPGGAVDWNDESLLHAVARELVEESGLVLTAITAIVGEAYSFRTPRGRHIIKQSFIAEVKAHDPVVLDPNEHANYVWVNEDEARAKQTGDIALEYTPNNQEQLVYDAFEVRKALLAKDKEVA